MKVKVLAFSLFFVLFHSVGISVFAGDVAYRIYFPVGSSAVALSYKDNRLSLDSLLSYIGDMQEKGVVFRISLEGRSSLEGNSDLNVALSEQRCKSLRSYIQQRFSLPDSIFNIITLGQDWNGLSALVKESEIPCREEVLRIIQYTPEWVVRGGVVVDSRKRQLMNICSGLAWRYMEEYFFPEFRSCSVDVKCEFEPIVAGKDDDPVISQKVDSEDTIVLHDTVERNVVIRDTVQIPTPVNKFSKPFYMGLKTNLLYDAFLIPNIGLEFYLGKGWSLGANWMYAWWKNDNRHRYWRVYGGEIGLRKYFSSRAAAKPLTGHHVGVYGQMLTYDFEFGGKGYMGGRPGGSLWEKSNYGVGLEYGYSLPIAKRFNLDFSLGIGYLGGTYYEYVPMDNHYVWQSTKNRHWFGPTKAEVSLVWLLGRDNYNRKKGGNQ